MAGGGRGPPIRAPAPGTSTSPTGPAGAIAAPTNAPVGTAGSAAYAGRCFLKSDGNVMPDVDDRSRFKIAGGVTGPAPRGFRNGAFFFGASFSFPSTRV